MKNAYLTIDDGPSARMMEKVDFLESNNIKAVWFCRGDYLEARPEHALHAITCGHIIGNHSYSHPKFSDLDLESAYKEIWQTDGIIENLYQQANIQRPAKYFRFPYGDKGDLRYGDLSLPLSEDGKFRKDALQFNLRSLGYFQPNFSRRHHIHHVLQGIFDDVDWRWTFDAMEWGLIKDQPPQGLDTVEKILARMDTDNPTEGHELHNSTLDEILLVHDQEHSHEIFNKIIGKFLEKTINFESLPF